MKLHHLKTIHPYFDHVRRGVKMFEIRKDDRGFEVGDYIRLQEYNPIDNILSGHTATMRIKYILRDAKEYGLDEGYCILGLSF